MEYTGERMVPEHAESDVLWEHIARYQFATRYAAGRKVVDVACGEGYGSAALMRAGAAAVTGVDISDEACLHARTKYNVDARQGPAEAMPIEDGAADLIVSFETIEHIADPKRFVVECYRILAPGGLLIVSTPNRPVYRQLCPANHFHCSEMTIPEFKSLISSEFEVTAMLGQAPLDAPAWTMASLVSRRSLWHRLPVVRRLLGGARRRLGPDLGPETEARTRLDTVNAICADVPRLSAVWCPHGVRALPTFLLTRCAYVVAVARKRKAP
jgi:ubiquinone/menaquinone biosynthesis C-methylase UbiE